MLLLPLVYWVVVLLLPLSLAMDDGDFDCGGGGVAGMVAWWRWQWWQW
jgi:hypothetical protein